MEDPWNFKGTINPSTDLIDLFEKWDKSKSTTERSLCYNRAKLWIARLLKREVQVPLAHKLRHEDIQNSLDHMFHNCFANGMSPKEYLIFCLAPLPTDVNKYEISNESSVVLNQDLPNDQVDIKDVNNSKTENPFTDLKTSTEESSSTNASHGASTFTSERPKTGKICKSTWKGLKCQTTGCTNIHTEPCTDR